MSEFENPEEINNYINLWLDTSVTIEDWLHFRNINHWDEINDYLCLDESKREKIENHQRELFYEHLSVIITNKINSLKERDLIDRVAIINEHLRVIDLFKNSTQTNHFIIALLMPIVRINEADYLPVLLYYQQKIHNIVYDIRTDYSISQDGKFLYSHSLNASILYRYEYELNKLRIVISNNEVQTLHPQQTETKTDKLKAELAKFGFFELPNVMQLSEPSKQRLVEFISTNGTPYSIAMFEYLGFLNHLKAEYFAENCKLHKAVANWFGVTERAIKGNISVLNEYSKEDRTRYTANQQKQTAQNDYQKLK